MNILDEILAHKRVELAAWRAATPLVELRAAAREAPRPDFVSSLLARPMGLIAEVKRRSPSAGLIRDPFLPADIARAYARGGAGAISVLMDEKYFGGGANDFRAVRAAVALPLLYKEFVVDEWQVWQAAALGASAVLLIVAALPAEELARLADVCREAGIEPLVEVHDEAETEAAVGLGVRCIGVNNRDLKTFRVTLETTHRLSRLVPRDCLLVGESGIRTAGDVLRLQAGGARAVLVGEQLLRTADLEQAVRDLMGAAWASL